MQSAQKFAIFFRENIFTKLEFVVPLATISDNDYKCFPHPSCESENTIMIFELQNGVTICFPHSLKEASLVLSPSIFNQFTLHKFRPPFSLCY